MFATCMFHRIWDQLFPRPRNALMCPYLFSFSLWFSILPILAVFTLNCLDFVSHNPASGRVLVPSTVTILLVCVFITLSIKCGYFSKDGHHSLQLQSEPMISSLIISQPLCLCVLNKYQKP